LGKLRASPENSDPRHLNPLGRGVDLELGILGEKRQALEAAGAIHMGMFSEKVDICQLRTLQHRN
jgi:hypothetical protein